MTEIRHSISSLLHLSFSKRSFNSAYPRDLKELIGGTTVTSGAQVNQTTAVGLTGVYQAVNIIASEVACLPIRVYKTEKNGNRTVIDHSIDRVLGLEPNHYQTPIEFQLMMVANLLLWGNSYAYVSRSESGSPLRLLPIHPNKVKEPIDYIDEIYYEVEGFDDLIPGRDLIHVKDLSVEGNGLKGKSRIELCKEAIGAGLAVEQFASSFFGNGANMGVVIKSQMGEIETEKQRKSLENSINAKYVGAKKSHKHIVLPSGFELSNGPNISPEQSQFIQTRRFTIEEIARIFNIPVSKLRDIERATFSNIEHQNIEFISETIRPIAKKFEQEYTRKLTKINERGKVKAKYNLNARMRGDTATQTEHIKTMLQNGVYSVNQSLKYLEENSIGPEGDERYIQSNQMKLGQTGIKDGE